MYMAFCYAAAEESAQRVKENIHYIYRLETKKSKLMEIKLWEDRERLRVSLAITWDDSTEGKQGALLLIQSWEPAQQGKQNVASNTKSSVKLRQRQLTYLNLFV